MMPINALPIEILNEFFNKLNDNLEQRFKVGQVCLLWRNLENDNTSVWKGAIDKEYGLGVCKHLEGNNDKGPSQTWRERYLNLCGMKKSPLTKLCCVRPGDSVTTRGTSRAYDKEDFKVSIEVPDGTKAVVADVDRRSLYLDVWMLGKTWLYGRDYICDGFPPQVISCHINHFSDKDKEDIRSNQIKYGDSIKTPINVTEHNGIITEAGTSAKFVSWYVDVMGELHVAWESPYKRLTQIEELYMKRAKEVCENRSCQGPSAMEGVVLGLRCGDAYCTV